MQLPTEVRQFVSTIGFAVLVLSCMWLTVLTGKRAIIVALYTIALCLALLLFLLTTGPVPV